MRQARLKYKILEPRILFAADQPADSDASHDQTTITSSDTTSATPDTSAPAPAPEEAHVVTADGGAPLTESVGTQVTTAAVAVQELVRNFLSGPDGNQILDQIFAGNGTPTADRSARIDAFIAALNAHEIDLRIELVDGSSMLGAYGAFAAKTDQGPTIYLDREWVEGGASQASLVRVITEEFGHFIDQWINGSADTAGDEGEAFALKSLNIQTTQDDWMRILSEDDHFVFHIDGQSVEVETAALIFNNVWNIVDEKAPPAYPTTGIDLEDNSITVGTKLDGASATRYVFQTTNPADPWFSGNNCQGTLYSIDSSNNVIASYFGEMSRLQKSGSIVNAIQFYVYPSGTNTSDPGHSVLVAVGSWTTTQGLSYGTSSDPVSAYLNTLLPTYTAPVASADTGIAFEKGGLNNATVPANNDATGNILSNDSVSGATYSIVNNKLVTTTGSATISSVLNGATGNSATPTSGTTSANGSTVTGAFGTLTIGADGSYKYVVNNSLATVEALRTNSNTLVESFTYTIKDVRGNASTATLSITIKGTNDTPIAADDYNVAKESIESTVANQYSVSDTIGLKATGSVLLNDTDVDGYSETKSIVGLSATATGATDGPTVLSFSGTTSLSNIKAGYYVCTVSGTTYTPLIGANGSQITVATISGSNITLSDTVNLGATGTLRFALKADGSSSGDTVTYTSTAASTGTGVKVSLTTSGYIAAGMTVTGTGVSSGTTVSSVTYDGSGNVTGVTLSQNATIASGTTLTFSSTAGTTITGRYGTLVLASNGTYTYTPFANNSNLNQGQTGVDNFLYTMQDQSAATSQAVLHITVLGSGSTDPNAIADTVSATEAGGLNNGTAGTNPTGSLLTNDTTPTGTKSVTALQAVQSSTVQTLTANSVSYNGTNYDVKATGIYGDFYVKSDGTYVYVVNNSLASVQALKGGATATDSFLYRMSNGTNVDWAAITVTVNGAYDTPVAVADVNSILASQTAVDGYVLMNDTDVDVGDTKTVTKVIAGTGSLPLSNNVASSSTATSNPTSVTGTYGRLDIGADGTYHYVLDTSNATVIALADGSTLTDTFTYQNTDAGSLNSTATLTITVVGTNQAPVNALPAGALSVNAGGSLNFTTSLNSSDVDSNLSSVTISVSHGILTINDNALVVNADTTTLADGAVVYGDGSQSEIGTTSITFYGTQAQINAALASLIYTPDVGFSGNDTLTMTSVDSFGLTDVHTKSINVLGSDPVVGDIVVNEGSPYAVFTVVIPTLQDVTLTLESATANIAGVGTPPTDGTKDFGPAIQYSTDNGAHWTTYTGTLTSVASNTTLLVRTAVVNDSVPDNGETFKLKVVGGTATVYGTATIKDDGTGTIFNSDGTENTSATKNNDMTVSSPTVNEASPYAVFTVTATAGQEMTLSLSNGSATIENGNGTDATDGTEDFGPGLEYSLDNGATWNTYTGAFTSSGTTVLVRTPIINDTVPDNGETFTLTATPTGGTDVTGTATIKDDGTGSIFKDDGTLDSGAAKNNDMTVSSPTVNEASPYAVFTVTATAGQQMTLALASGTATIENGNGTVATNGSEDFGPGLEYSLDNGATWQTYTGAFTSTGTTVLVRTPIVNDTLPDNGETFTLSATPTGGSAVTGTATIKDDGTGTVFKSDGTTDLTAAKNNDITVSDITVNEASNGAVFTIRLTQGQQISLALNSGSALIEDGDTTPEDDGSEDFGPGLEYSLDNGTTWLTYVSGNITATGTAVLVRTPVINDNVSDNGETFTLDVTAASGTTVTGTATIKDDGTGTIFDANGAADASAVKNDDRPITVSDLLVNEGSPYAVFKVTGTSGQVLTLALRNDTDPATANASIGTDTGTQLQYFNGTSWVNYSSSVTLPASGDLLVRVAITQDSNYEGAETFQLEATVAGGSVAAGTATIVDDGTGNIYPDNTTGNPDVNAVKDDDRAVKVNDIQVNEGSPYAVFTLNGSSGQLVALALQNDADASTVDATLGTDIGTQLQYFNGTSWVNYSSGSVALDADGKLLVRVAVTQDATYEGPEVFQLKVTPNGGTAVTGNATIFDDGTGAYYPDNVTGNPDPNHVLDDDRAVTVNNIIVNEASPYAVFKINGNPGQNISLNLQNDGSVLTADAIIGTDTGTQLEYFDGTSWVNYSPGLIPMPASGELLVRVALAQDAVYEGPETFQLLVSVSGGTDVTGTATIYDDGTGAYYPDNNTGNPDPDHLLDDDRAVSVNNIAVNEGSPYAVFTITATAGQQLTLALQNDNDLLTTNAVLGTDTGTQLQYFNGTTWVDYTTSATVPANGTMLVRVAVTQDSIYEGAETFQLRVTPNGGSAVVGTATIYDDGTGAYYPDNNTGNPDPTQTLDDDRAVSVNSIRVNEGSPYAVFTVTATAGQQISLGLQNDNDRLTANAILGTDTGTQLQYYNGSSWVNYTSGNITMPTDGKLLVRLTVTQDSDYEGAETFQLVATPSGGTAAYGTATILDDGTGDYYPNNMTGDPDPTHALDDDRPVSVNSISVNEGSPYAVFTVTASAGQQLTLALQASTDPITGHAKIGTDIGSQLQYYDGSNWVDYVSGVTMPAGGSLLVRVTVTQDNVYEGAEAFHLVATPTGGLPAYGTATIYDDGTGDYYPDNTTGATDPTQTLDDDRVITVDDIDVNEGSPYAVFTVTGLTGQRVSLSLQNDSNGATDDATLGTDLGTQLQYYNGSAWVNYTSGTVAIPSGGVMLVRVAITQDTQYEIAETFQLRVANSNGNAVTGTATIHDDGTGDIYPDNNTGAKDPTAEKDNDLPIAPPPPPPAPPPPPPAAPVLPPAPPVAASPISRAVADSTPRNNAAVETSVTQLPTAPAAFNLPAFGAIMADLPEFSSDGSFKVNVVDTAAAPGTIFSATLANGQPLPPGVSIDPATGQISGRMPEGIQALDVKIIATTPAGSRSMEVKVDATKPRAERTRFFALLEDQLHAAINGQLVDLQPDLIDTIETAAQLASEPVTASNEQSETHWLPSFSQQLQDALANG